MLSYGALLLSGATLASRAHAGVFAQIAEPMNAAMVHFERPVIPAGPPVWEGDVWKLHVRLYPSMFFVQGCIVLATLVYATMAVGGRILNRWAAQQWTKALAAALQDEFAVARPKLVWNGGDEAMLYATGRRGTTALQALVKLSPRHDPIQYLVCKLYDVFALPASPTVQADRAVLSFVLPQRARGACGTFALIDKVALRHVRADRFDLSVARVAESNTMNSSHALDERWAIASENANITDKMLGEAGARGDKQRTALGLVPVLNSPAAKWLESLVWTDLPAARPTNGPISEDERIERLELTLYLPRTSAQAREALPLVAAALDIVDALHLSANGRSDLLALRADAQAVLQRTRLEIDVMLAQERDADARADAKDEEDNARREAATAKQHALTPAAQERRKALEKKRAQRKAQGKFAHKKG